MKKSLAGKVVLITGGTRGIGKAIAVEAAVRGAGVIITYRDAGKTNRANRVLHSLENIGGTILLRQLDITIEPDRRALLQEVKEKFGKIDALVLNAAGGLEADKGSNYAMLINRDSNIGLLNEAIELGLMGEGAWAIYLTSTWAHEYGTIEPPEFYLPVASTKRVAETDLRALIPELSKLGIGLGVVVAPLVSDTGAYAIMKLKFKVAVEQETKDAGMVTPEAVSAAVLSYLDSPAPESGHTIYVK